MYRFIQRNGKHLMAVFSVFLMIAFTLPSAYKRASCNRMPIGKVGGETVYADDAYHARRSWELLNTVQVRPGMPITATLGPQAVAEINAHPVAFYLLQKEAHQMGVAVNTDQLEGYLRNTPGLLSTDEDRNAAIKQAMASLMLVGGGFTRAADAIKVSEPMVKHDLAMLGQTINVNTVEFTTAKYKDKVKSPTAEQVKAQFEKFADLLKGGIAPNNPFGFGYRYPDRIKLQYIMVPKADVRKVVADSKDDYTWKVESQKYYIQNPKEFEATAGGKAFDFTPSTTKPTTKPFAVVEMEVKDKLIEKETAAKLTSITDRIVSTMASDWVAYRATAPTAAPTTASASTAPTSTALSGPLSSLRVPYASFEYLQKVAGAIQKEFKVLPTVVSVADKWMDADELEKLPGLSSVALAGAPMAQYMTLMASPFLDPANRNRSEVLDLFEPTQPMHDTVGSVFIARISGADPSHKPGTFVEVENAVMEDLSRQSAYELAKADATKLLDEARQRGLSAAATGMAVIPVGPLTARAGDSVPGLTNLTGPTAGDFLRGAFALLSTATSRPDGQPAALIELPREGRIFVTELGKVEAIWTQKTLPFDIAQVQGMNADRLRAEFSRTWYDFDSLKKRMNFIPDASFKESEALPTPEMPAAPMF